MKKIRLLVVILLGLAQFALFAPELEHGSFHFYKNSDKLSANAEENGTAAGFPYSQTFTISAYYSPLPCQNRYATGSYEADIRLNGRGTNGADGTEVYPGMIAAPSKYVFGTKMYIPGVGIVGVHDRGGAIVQAGQRGHAYDRLDIWMGYGDKGLTRALNWGKRDVEVTVYGQTSSVVEDIFLDGYSSSEGIPNKCDLENSTPEPTLADSQTDVPVQTASVQVASGPYNTSLSFGDSGSAVTTLQEELKRLNFYWSEPSGVFDELTEHAVLKFQQARGVITSKDDLGAGVVGPQTRSQLNGIFAMRENTLGLIAEATERKKEDKIALN